MKILAPIIASFMLVAASGCEMTYSFDNYWGYEYYGGDPESWGEPLQTGPGEIMGDFGETSLNAPIGAEVTGWHNPAMFGMDVATVEVQGSQSDGWTSMALVEIYGGLDQESLAPGETATFHIEDDAYDSFVMVTGCTGQDPMMWEYDEIAEEVTLAVDPEVDEDGMRTVHFTAWFNKTQYLDPQWAPQRTRLEGSFRVRSPAP